METKRLHFEIRLPEQIFRNPGSMNLRMECPQYYKHANKCNCLSYSYHLNLD